MRLRPLVLFLLSMMLLSGCDKTLMKEKRQEIDKINLRGLLDTLHTPVFKANPLLIKVGSMDGQRDSVALHLDSAQWKKEFENFSDLKLRPGNLLSLFDETIIKTDSTTIYRYTAKDLEKEDLDSFVIEMKNDQEIRFLKAYINSENFFSASSQELSIAFSGSSKNALPDHYYLDGWQKIKSKDTVHFTIGAEIRY